MRLAYKFFSLPPLFIIGTLIIVCFGISIIAALIFALPAQAALAFGLLIFLFLLIPVAFKLHRLSQLRN